MNAVLLYVCAALAAAATADLHTLSAHADGPIPYGRGVGGPHVYPGKSRREAVAPTTLSGVSDKDMTTKVFHLNETRQQLMVHWVGENSNVIICLAREGHPSSAVYLSYDYGETYINKTEEFKIDANTNLYASIDKFYINPAFNTYCVYTDVINRKIFTTTDHSKHLKSIQLSFVPSEVTYRPDEPFVFIVHDKVSPTKTLWITHDFGITWTRLEEHVKSYFWIPAKWNLYKSGYSLVIQREESATTSVVIALTEKINSGQNSLYTLAENVVEMKVKDDYMFVYVQLSKNNLDLLVSYKGGPFIQTRFDTELDRQNYHIADVTANRIMVAVAHSRTLSNLYISDVMQSSNEEALLFSLSLERVVAYFPNITWTESLISDLWAEPFADIHKVKGLQGIYIVSQLSPSTQPGIVDIGPEHIVTLISFDWGVDWRLLNVTAFSTCEKGDNCSLHLTQMFSHVYPVTRTHTFILSSKSAPGIIMATGVYGKSLKGHPGLFVSRDAGLTWKQVLKDMHFYNIGDHGGVLIAVRYYKGEKEVTSQILYSTDEGETWLEKNFTNSQIKVYQLMTEPGENTTVFSMFGSVMEKHEWLIVKIDLKNAFSHNCTQDNYKLWSPTSSKDHLKTSCILGQSQIFQRRALKANCYNGIKYDRPIQTKTCDCDVEDYTCDHGFTWFSSSKQCIRNKTSSFDPYLIPSSCKPGLMYNRTKGYRLIPGDMCKSGRTLEFIPQEVPCPFEEKPEFLLVAQKERILRFSGNSTYEVLPVRKLENVIAVEFDVKNNCVFWADIATDTIGRQCLTDSKEGPEILVNSGLNSVEGMAYDWISKHLYFVDGALAKIEVIRTDTKIPGHMRKTILGPTHLKKPRGIAVHPRLGYLFWTDWAVGEAKVARANLDGSDVKTLICDDSIEWPNGLAVDYIAERVYWVDARHDYIASCDLHGNNIKKVLKNDEKVSHPFAVAILKDFIYWDDWKQNSIFMSDKDHAVKIQTITANLPGLMDLKVFSHMSQTDTNECSNNKCSHFCFGLPNKTFSCQCPDNMSKSDNSCLCPGLKEPFANGTCPSAGHTCSADYFQCHNGHCVPKYWKCDGDNDCADNSDEIKCAKVSCGPNSFQCRNGKCIPSYWTCDFDPDCEDSSDELNCKYTNCSEGQFRCKNGRCISMHWRCDLEDDCHDGSDEADCSNDSNNSSTTCPSSSYHCPGTAKTCIPIKWQCDGEKDCPDGKDELNCEISNCESWQFECAKKKCIFASWRCDGDDDCDDGLKSDEVNCSSTTRTYPPEPTTTPESHAPTNGNCSEWLFRCSNGKCIPYWWKCDRVMDCEDGLDEDQCGTLSPTNTKTNISIVTPKNIICPQHYFQCNSGLCIEDSWVCDEIFDCEQGEDETNCKNNNFVGRCKNNSREFKCRISGSCISIEKVCDGTPQCPDGSDEFFCTNNNQTPGTPSCGVGLFPCDGSRCIPASRRCDKHRDCYDGTDEDNCDTMNQTLSIQVSLMYIDEHETTSNSLSLFWAAPKKPNLEYLPSISESRMPETCVNKTWVPLTHYKFTSLKPYTTYNMTVYVRQRDDPDTIYTPVFFILASTAEGVPSAPLNVIVKEVNAEEVLVTWTRPENPAGRISSYNVYVEPPHPAMVLSVEADYNNITQSYSVRSSLYRKNIEYSFWVTAKLSEFESEHSAVKRFHFDEDSLVDVNLKLNITGRTENSITVSWESVEHADGFNIVSMAPIKEGPYPNSIQSFNVSNKNSAMKFTITKLSPGVTYTIHVVPYNKQYTGMKYTIVTKTEGQPLPSVTNITGSLVNIKDKKESTIKVQWNAPKLNTRTKWLYGVYYGTNPNDLLNGPKYNTSATMAILSNIESCTSLRIDVGVIGPNGIGPLSKSPFDIITPFDPTVPPKDIKIELVEGQSNILISWKASCHPSVQQSYKVTILESSKNDKSEFNVTNVSETEAYLNFKINYGGNYFICISTTSPNAVPSSLINYRAPALPSPHQVKVFSLPDGHYEIYWKKPTLPSTIQERMVHYLVHMSEGSGLNVTTSKTYKADKSPFIINDPPTSNQLSMAVQLETNEGYVSEMSEVVSFIPGSVDIQTSEVVVVGVNTGWMSMLLVLIVIGLSGGLTYFVIRHRNLQNSFVQFANSRYDTRSGSATFTGVDSLDDEPAVQGFSDDEPLVIT